MEQGYQCPTCGKPLVFLPQYQFWHCQGCGGYFQYQQTPAALQQPPEGKSKKWMWITVFIVVLAVIIAVALMTLDFSADEDSDEEIETTETTPEGALDFTESVQTPGRYMGSFVSLSKHVELSNASMTIMDDSLGSSQSIDPIENSILVDTGEMNATYFDINENGKIDGGDTIRVENADSDDIIKFVYRPTGGVIAQYTFI